MRGFLDANVLFSASNAGSHFSGRTVQGVRVVSPLQLAKVLAGLG